MKEMFGLKYLAKIREYCDYLEEHIKNVEWAWKVLQEKCKDFSFIYDDYVFNWIDSLIKEHDLSKFSQEEFIPYCQKFYPVVENNECVEYVFKEAWEHHKTHNEHHWENWADKKYYNPHEAECHCVCMVIDWMAMGKKFGDSAQEYYEKNKEKITLPDWAIKFCYEIFERIN